MDTIVRVFAWTALILNCIDFFLEPLVVVAKAKRNENTGIIIGNYIGKLLSIGIVIVLVGRIFGWW